MSRGVDTAVAMSIGDELPRREVLASMSLACQAAGASFRCDAVKCRTRRQARLKIWRDVKFIYIAESSTPTREFKIDSAARPLYSTRYDLTIKPLRFGNARVKIHAAF